MDQKMIECQINIVITSQDDGDIGDDCCFDLVIEPGQERAAIIRAARGAMEALRKEGINASALTT